MPLAALLLAAATPVLGCDDRITGASIQPAGGAPRVERFEIDRRRDTVFGPLAFSGMRTYDRAAWDDFVRRDQWMKAIPRLRPGARATLVIPPSQRGWMRFSFADGPRVRLQACRRGEGESGPSGNTAWSGGFVIDYAKAPDQGRCARLVVRTRGRVIRKRIAPRAGRC